MARRLLMTRSSMSFHSRRVTRTAALGRTLRARGFTLVELAIVVAIVGVLAVIAVVGYRKLTLSAKMTEAQTMISAIRIAQEDYRTERGIYADIGANVCPAGAGVTQEKWQWNPACSGGGTSPTKSWKDLPVHVDGPVQFGYTTVAGPNGGALPATFVNTAKADFTKPWYFITAEPDLNGDAKAGVNTKLHAMSFTNQIFSENDGQ
jgi:type IV pilus assembly protein PilA